MSEAKGHSVGYRLKEVFECAEPGCGKPARPVKVARSNHGPGGTFWQCPEGHLNRGRNHYVKRIELKQGQA